MTSSRIREVFETRKVVSLSVLGSCQEEPQRMVSARLGNQDGPDVACCGSRVHELC